MKLLIANKSQLDTLYSIVVECSQWLKEKQINQWSTVYPKNRFIKELEEGKVFYFLDNSCIIGTVTLLDKNPDYFPNRVFYSKKSGLYICRLALKRSLTGTGYGKKMLLLIEKEAKRRAVHFLRLDCVESNPFLEKYYKNAGFDVMHRTEINSIPSVFMEKTLI